MVFDTPSFLLPYNDGIFYSENVLKYINTQYRVTLPCRRYGRGGCAEGTAIVGNAVFNLGGVQHGESQ